MATHSIILAWKISWTEESRRLQSKKWGMAEHACTLCIGDLPVVFFICTYFPYRENVTGQETSLSNEESAGYCDLHMTGGPVHRMGSWCPGSWGGRDLPVWQAACVAWPFLPYSLRNGILWSLGQMGFLMLSEQDCGQGPVGDLSCRD